MKKIIIMLGALGLTVALAACSQNNTDKMPEQNNQQEKAEPMPKSNQEEDVSDTEKGGIASDSFYEPFAGKIDHVHGLGYVGNQNAVFLATHDGLKAYENGKWYKTIEENHDYMGFNAINEGFYASGHPEPGSNLINPFGIKKSLDNGRSLEALALEGETDFHAMGVGYDSKVIYVMNPEKNSLMSGGQFYMSEDDAKTWKKTAAKGLGKDIFSIAVHPKNSDILAVAGKEGIYLSKDKGETFHLMTKGLQGTSVFMTEDTLWYGGYNGQAVLVKRSLENDAEENVALPEMEQDAVMYLAQNPKNHNEVTFVTFNGDVFMSKDGTQTWNILIEKGEMK
ncbi:F510_1955 family glycosylhydrolase [Ammoniphilus sp. 3BR4]|uniref:F510_1955 family glycosylhydrolase n=1 Tax=Ammoniphilus sp. 3BR4 TaxID=3158265 RepID=UPI0034667129